MPCRPRRLVRRLFALAPVLAALGGQALAAGSLRAPFLPHVGTTPAPSSAPCAHRAAESTPIAPDGEPAASQALEAGLATLRREAATARRPDLEARLDRLVGRGLPGAARPDGAPMSRPRNIPSPGTADPRPWHAPLVTR